MLGGARLQGRHGRMLEYGVRRQRMKTGRGKDVVGDKKRKEQSEGETPTEKSLFRQGSNKRSNHRPPEGGP